MMIPDLWDLQEPSQMQASGAGGITWTDTKLTVDGIFITLVVRDGDIKTDQWKVDAATRMYWFIVASCQASELGSG